jgi:hypothetical protein
MPLLRKEDVIVAALAPGGAVSYSPVQIQKLLFLIDREISDLVGGPHFRFKPYHYGPFDRSVYDVLEELEVVGDVEVNRDMDLRIREFRLTQGGIDRGVTILKSIPPKAKDYIERVSSFVRRSSFTQLVSSIYKAYPEMKKRSIFAS